MSYGIFVLMFFIILYTLNSLVSYLVTLFGWLLLTATCRASFHPLCAREARHRMEIWAKNGYDNVSILYLLKLNPVLPSEQKKGKEY